MLQLTDINFAFAKARTLKDISLELEQGCIAAVMGESGCGKSTLLNLIYGLLEQDSGTVTWNDEELLGADHHLVPGHPMMKYVPQEFDLMPYTTVFENVGEHLSIQLDDRSQTIQQLLRVVEMESFSDRKVKTLSGGQKQRVAIAKALAQQPKLLLLDEPFSHVDNFRKNNLRRQLFKYLREENISCLIATHDRGDVLSFTDETIVMKAGEIVDHRPTIEIYNKPKDFYVASLFDDINVVGAGFFNNDQEMLFYPHQLMIADSGVPAVVKNSYFKGDYYLLKCEAKNQMFWVNSADFVPVSSNVFLARF
ncbi:ABC-type Fe3+/spermidine/putrescine transport systems, ATPase components [Nonlabens sp. Hel1_33_55]|uniref:ABC transporter ATP-binding protein n=1 Tax=Nonlabens sp. Hel1_33_55 TaxID=1336802 RepID=UPI000875BD44|nr:ABC transporter ATP-binding protein [Nonlabens sp. Hel1_33_55]SCY34254.1 ABC-type Fe3+/spermidine/putrescine transport systems, ATPase components [Nonlabens sp. Hel1_33_55]